MSELSILQCGKQSFDENQKNALSESIEDSITGLLGIPPGFDTKVKSKFNIEEEKLFLKFAYTVRNGDEFQKITVDAIIDGVAEIKGGKAKDFFIDSAKGTIKIKTNGGQEKGGFDIETLVPVSFCKDFLKGSPGELYSKIDEANSSIFSLGEMMVS